MKRAILFVVLTACATQPPVTPPPPDAATLAAIERIEGLVVQQPANVAYLYVLATYYDRARDADNVVRVLTRLDELGFRLGLGPDSFPNTSSTQAFRRIASRLEAREEKVNRGATAFKLPETVRSEGITYDPVDDVFYMAGPRTAVLRIDRKGTVKEIAVEPMPERFGRLGMDVDAQRRQLWIVGAMFDSSAGLDVRERSNVSVYDLRDGRLIRRVSHGSGDKASFLNDLTLLSDGSAFVTDTGANQVLRLGASANEFEVWAEDFRSPNGIAISADERTLYVADFRGINAFDVATKTRKLLETSTPLNGIDGLVEYRGSLIGIQNVLGRPRVVRVHVNEDNRVELLESKNPLLDTPATGVVAGDHYYFLANLSDRKEEKIVMAIPL